MTASPLAARLGPVLYDVAFPAAKWQLITAADAYGADVVSKTDLHMLPERHYVDLRDVVLTVQQIRAGVEPTTVSRCPRCRR